MLCLGTSRLGVRLGHRPGVRAASVHLQRPSSHGSGDPPPPAAATRAPYGVDPSSGRVRVARGRGENARWLDSLRVYCRGGAGGHGFPNKSGNGGAGGDCVIEVEKKRGSESLECPSLYAVFKNVFQGDSTKQRLLGKNGEGASKTRYRGRPGEDAVLKVPSGVSVVDDQNRLIRNLDSPGDRVVVARGGEGGGPANNWLGLKGQARHIRLDLKLIADIGLVGFPNAGKSTLLKAVSRASPKIAGYPFTTIRPNLGHIGYPDDRVITMADLPGLIEGAHYNVGMGYRFLKHVERTRLLLFVIDVNGFRLNENSEFRTAFQTLTLLNRELELYKPDLVEKPAVCLLNKMDVRGSQSKFEEFTSLLNDSSLYEKRSKELPEELRPEKRIKLDEVIPMSAKFSSKSVQEVKARMRSWIDHHELEACERSGPPGELALVKGGRDEEDERRESVVKYLERRLRDANKSKGPTLI